MIKKHIFKPMIQKDYIPEKYWDEIAAELMKRRRNNLLAGDNDPFYVYKRKKFIKLFSDISFAGKKVIEIGSGPGGNLLEIYKQQPTMLTGADISEAMLNVCRQNIENKKIELVKTNGGELPFGTASFDIVITSAVLQHVTDDMTLRELAKNISRIAGSDIYIFERIEKNHKEKLSNTGRTIEEYKQLFDRYSLSLDNIHFLNVYWSKLFCGFARKIFNSSKRKEGAPQTRVSVFLQKVILIITRPLDNLIPVKKDIAMLHFRKQYNAN